MEVRARPEVLGAVILAGLALLAMLGIGIVLLVPGAHRDGDPSVPTSARSATAPTTTLPTSVVPADMTQALVDPAQLRPIGPQEAIAFNASIPISKEPNPPARPFTLSKADPQDVTRATDCLTAAVYYESATEPEAGQRAVAQAVLNRVRHFAYAKTVCGVVFQGADRTTGCQFTFTCDGSMTRAIVPELWAQARKVASAALDGHVEKSVGYATHYHADYVAPYWQPTLVKVAVIGHHIFYRGADGWGRPTAFVGRYAGGEPDVAALTAAIAVVEPAPPAVVDIAPPVVLSQPAADALPTIVLVPPALSSPAAKPPAGSPAPVAAASSSVPPTGAKRMTAPREPQPRRLPM